VIGLELGLHDRAYQGIRGPWLRWYTPEGQLLPIGDEMAEQERARADALQKRLTEYETRFGKLD
jgi:hypothetical protein